MEEYPQIKTFPLSVLPQLYQTDKGFLVIVEGEYIGEENHDFYCSFAEISLSFQSVPRIITSFLREFPDCFCRQPFFSGLSRKSRKIGRIERIVRQHNRRNFPNIE